MNRLMTKPTNRYVRPAKTQLSLGIRPIWSESLLCALRTQGFFMRTVRTLIRLDGCPGWSESSLGAHAILLVLSWGGSYATSLRFWSKHSKEVNHGLIWVPSRENLSSGFATRYDSNRPAQPHRLATVLRFWIQQVDLLYYLCSEQQRCWSDCADAQADMRLCCSHWHKQVFSWCGSFIPWKQVLHFVILNL